MSTPSPSGASATAHDVVRRLRDRGLTLATAESLTGGLLAGLITGVPGASSTFRGSVVAYATDLKVELLGVPADVVAEHGVVSAPTAAAMASGAREVLGVDHALSTTGVAGPDPQDGRPPGVVFVAHASSGGQQVRALRLDGDREQVRVATCGAALDLLLAALD